MTSNLEPYEGSWRNFDGIAIAGKVWGDVKRADADRYFGLHGFLDNAGTNRHHNLKASENLKRGYFFRLSLPTFPL